MAFLVSQGSFTLFLPVSSLVLNCTDQDGSVSMMLARSAELVVCLCPNQMSAQVIRHNLGSDCDNIVLVVGSSNRLPFCGGVFSLVVHHFFSWKRNFLWSDENQFLIKCCEYFRVTEPSGVVYSAFELSNNYLRQAIQKIIFIPLLLSVALIQGFKPVSIIFHYESFEELFFIRVFSVGSFTNIKNIYFALKRSLLGNNLGFLFSDAARLSGSRLLIKQIRSAIEAQSGCALGKLNCFRVGSGGSVIVEFDHFIVRIPLNKDAAEFAMRNFTALKFLEERNLPFVSPAPVMEGQVHGFSFFCETRIPGISLDLEKGDRNRDRELLKYSVRILSSSSMRVCNANSENLTALIDNPLTALKKSLPSDNWGLFEKTGIIARRLLLDNQIPLVIFHGDYKKSNFILQQNQQGAVLGVIDWECMMIPGLPLLDLLRYFIFEEYGWEDDDQEILPKSWKIVCQRKYPTEVKEYCTSLGIALDLLPTLYLLFFVNYLFLYCYEDILKDSKYRSIVLEDNLFNILKEYVSCYQ